MFGSSWRVGRIAGIEIRIDSSWVVIALLITYSLYAQFIDRYLFLEPVAAILLAVGAAGLFFGSVLGHEMAHALVARRRGIPVRGITLFLFGGATHAEVESRRARDEFLVSIVGPLSSLLLAALFLIAARLTAGVLPRPITGGLGYLMVVNFILAVFNILPGFPLDGGRVLRATIWHFTGSFSRATRVASISGQVLGYGLIAAGAVVTFLGNLGTGIWSAMIGWFLAQAARASLRELEARRVLEAAEARDVMVSDVVSIPADSTLRDAVERYFKRFEHGAFPVDADGRTIGFLTVTAVNRVPSEEWDSRSVREHIGSVDEEVTVGPSTRMDRVLSKLQANKARRVLVVREGDVVGIITPTDVARWVQRWRGARPSTDET